VVNSAEIRSYGSCRLRFDATYPKKPCIESQDLDHAGGVLTFRNLAVMSLIWMKKSWTLRQEENRRVIEE